VIVEIILSQKEIVDRSPIFNQTFVSELQTAADLANVPTRIPSEQEEEEEDE
jgi:hypothetical protein